MHQISQFHSVIHMKTVVIKYHHLQLSYTSWLSTAQTHFPQIHRHITDTSSVSTVRTHFAQGKHTDGHPGHPIQEADKSVPSPREKTVPGIIVIFFDVRKQQEREQREDTCPRSSAVLYSKTASIVGKQDKILTHFATNEWRDTGLMEAKISDKEFVSLWIKVVPCRLISTTERECCGWNTITSFSVTTQNFPRLQISLTTRRARDFFPA